MKRSQKFLQALMVLALCASLLAPAALQAAARPTRVQAALAEVVATAPDALVRVLVQKAGTTDQAEALVARLGGEVTKDLYFIHSFAAELPGSAVSKLGQSASVNWVALDAPMTLATTSPPTVRDEFSSISFSGSNGTLSWASDWVGINETDGPDMGDDRVLEDWFISDPGNYRLRVRDDDGGGEGVQRQVDLAGAVSATLSFLYRRDGLDNANDYVAVEISVDGGASWTELDRFAGAGTDNVYQSWSADISTYLASPTMIRFISSASLGGVDQVYFDNIQIEIEFTEHNYLDTLGIDELHTAGLTGQGVTVAVVDSGIANHADFAGRLVSTYEYGIGDPYGHGTHVAGIIGGSGSVSGGLYTGVAPGVDLISLGVTDPFGMSYESDVVAALQWVFENNEAYNIRVVNISLNSTVEDSYNNSAIDAAVEILWFKGIVVVASAGNSGTNGTINNAKAAPANDPFIIVVGASDEYDTAIRSDDLVASFTAYGTSLDGHFRPDVIAPGYNLYAPLSPESSWDASYPERLAFGDQYIRLSGTSMAAPTVAGVVALLLEDEPNLTPNQIKYRITYSNGILTAAEDAKFPYLNAYTAIHGTTTAEDNQGLIPHQVLAKMALLAYWASENGGATIDWGSVNWDSVNWDSVNWDSVNWDSVNWDSVNWDSVNWDSVNWDSVNWDSVNWDSVNWDSANWDSVNWDSVNWDSVNWDSGTGSTTMNGLIAKFGPEDATRAVKQVRSDGLFWGEYERNPAPAADCVPATEKGNTPLTVCPVETVLEK